MLITSSVSFDDWLITMEWIAFLEGALDPLRAAAISTNPILSKDIGVENSWYEMMFRASQAYVKGQDAMDVANQIAAEVLNDIKNNGNLKTQIDAIKSETADNPEEGRRRTIALLNRDATLRAKRISQEYTRGLKNKNVRFSTLDKPDKQAIADIPDTSEAEPLSTHDIGDLAKSIIDELDNMKEEEKDIRVKRRLEIAKVAAQIRIDAIPQPVGYDEMWEKLKEKGFDVGRSQVDIILKDVQRAWANVSDNMGLSDISANIQSIQSGDRYKKKKTG